MKLYKPLLLILIFAFTTECVSPKAISVVAEGTDINAYKLVFITPVKYEKGPEDRYGVRAYVEQKLTTLGLKIVSEYEVKRLAREDALRLLFCSIQHSHTDDGMGFGGTYATVKIEMYDAAQNTIYSGTGRYQGLSNAGDLTGATNHALEGFVARYKGFNSSIEPRAVRDLELDSNKFNNWETIQKSKVEMQAYFDENLETLDAIEGIWTDTDNTYQIGIMHESSNPRRDFVGIIIRTDQFYWKPGQVKVELDATTYSSIYSASYFMSDHTRQGTTALIDENGLLQIEVKQPDGSPLKITFIKNYPAVGVSPKPIAKVGSGSGFLFSTSGLIATNFHLIEGASNISISIPDHEPSYLASIVLKDENNDLAILRIEGFDFNDIYREDIPFSIADSSSAQVGQDVFAIGFPLGSFLGKSAKLSKGNISSLFGVKDDPRLFQISNPIQPGNSGSPLFNMNGELVGIVVASLNSKLFLEKASIIPQNVNFAIKSDYLRNLISMLPESKDIISRKSKLRGKAFEAQVEILTRYTVAVEVK